MKISSLMLIVSMFFATAAVAAEPEEILLWPKVRPGSEGQTAPEKITETGGVRRVSSIHHPSITAHLPSKETANGAAVIVLPGGGHQYLSIDNEGHAAAQWLADRGVAAFVLKYRLAREPGSTYKVDVHALQDAQRALRLVRNRAKEWNLDPQRVGMLGFSAGGEIATYAAVRFDAGNPQADDPIDREILLLDFQGKIHAGIGKIEGDLPSWTHRRRLSAWLRRRRETGNRRLTVPKTSHRREHPSGTARVQPRGPRFLRIRDRLAADHQLAEGFLRLAGGSGAVEKK